VRLRLDVAYDGADFHGWAAQPGLRTVEGELSAALATVLRVHARDGSEYAGKVLHTSRELDRSAVT